jgi:glucose/arabinose dehydrogenase
MFRSQRRTFVVGSVAAVAGLLLAGADVTVANAAPVEPLAERQVTTGVGIPWGVTFLPDGSAYVAERNSHRILRVTSTGTKTTVGTVPGGAQSGEGGLLGLAVAPGFPASGTGRLFAYQSVSGGNRVVRIQINNHQLGAVTPIVTGIVRATYHSGGRLRFGPDGHLYIGTGDAQQESRAQDRNSLNGKILRVTQDGAAAPGNPWGTRVYSMGHRNVQGLAFDSQGRLWSAEFGPSTVDELNLIRSGGNYGWGGCSTGNCIGPVRTWPVAQASPSGITIIGNTIYMACLRGQRLYRMQISGNGVTGVTALYQGRYGRLRTVEAAPGGGFWMTTSNRDANGTPRAGDDRIIHVT